MATTEIISKLKEGDIIEISGYYFTWEVKKGYSKLHKKNCTHAIAQGGLMHNDLEDALILSINNKPIKI